MAPETPINLTSDQLTTYAESAPTIEGSPQPQGSIWDQFANPYEEQDLTKVLTRSYKVAEFEWEATDSEGAAINFVRFPEALFLIPNIASKLEQFEWLRADVELEVKINATEFHNGALMLSTMPHFNGTSDDCMSTHEQRCQAQNVTVMPASAVNSVRLKIARAGPRMFDQAHDVATGQIGALYIDVFHPLTNAAGTTPSPVKITVFANFSDPHVAGYGVTPLSPQEIRSRIKRIRHPGFYAKHSKTSPHKEAVNKSKSGLVSGIAEAIGSAAPLIAVSPLAEFAPFAMMAGAAAPFLKSMGLDKPVDLRGSAPVRADYWRDLIHGHGLFDGTRIALHPEAGLSDVKGMSQLGRHSIADITSRPQCIKKGVITSLVPTNDPFEHFPVTPGLSMRTGVQGSSAVYYPSHLAYLSQMFNKWRGSMKIHIKFISSRFTTARLRILHFPNAELPPDLEEFAGDSCSVVIDLRGNTEFSFSVPHYSAYPYLPIPGFYMPGDLGTAQAVPFVAPHVAFSLVNPVCIPESTGNSDINYSIWVSAGDDFEFCGFNAWYLRPSSGVVALPLVAQKDEEEVEDIEDLSKVLRKAIKRSKTPAEKHSLEDTFKAPFKPLVQATGQIEAGLVSTEKFTSMQDLLHRFELDYPAGGDAIPIKPDMTNSPNTIFKKFFKLFQFYRGSQRFKIAYSANSGIGYVEYPTQLSTRVAYTGLTPTLDVEIPWDEYSYCAPTILEFDEDQIDPNHVPQLNHAGIEYYFRSVGEDFQFGSLKPCPFAVETPVPPLASLKTTKTNESTIGPAPAVKVFSTGKH